MVAANRFLLLCAAGLLLTSPVPAEASTGAEAIVVNPLVGRAGQTVTVTGTGWQEHFRVGWDVPIWIGFANEVARGHPDANGKFSVSFPVPSSSPEGELQISAIIGNGGGAHALYIVSATGCVDAYFIGLHGVGQGPDSLNDTLPKSQEIEETGRNFKALKPQNKSVALDSLDYHAPTPGIWNLPEFANIESVARQAVTELNTKINGVRANCATQGIVLVGYSFGAWVIDDWLDLQWHNQSAAWNYVRAVELYGDPLWYRGIHGGLARRWDPVVKPQKADPYNNTPPGYSNWPLADRWQSLCLQNDPVCGEGYTIDLWNSTRQRIDAANCDAAFCEHQKYALYPKANLVGYGSTKGGAEFLASKAFQ